MSNTETEQKLFKISTASRITGIRVETLRAWDKRNQLVATKRIGNTRYYSQEQVDRLIALHTLITSGIGYAIGDLSLKTTEELNELVMELHDNPQLHPAPLKQTLKDAALIVGWRLMKLRDTDLEDDDHRTSAPNLYDLQSFYEYLQLIEHDVLQVAVVELPATWNHDLIKELREKVDALNQSDCHLIGVCYQANPDLFQQDKDFAAKMGLDLVDGRNLTWSEVLNQIESARRSVGDSVQETAARVDRAGLFRLINSDVRITGVAVADIARLYGDLEELAGLANREIDRYPYDRTSTALLQHLNSILNEFESCLSIVFDYEAAVKN